MSCVGSWHRGPLSSLCLFSSHQPQSINSLPSTPSPPCLLAFSWVVAEFACLFALVLLFFYSTRGSAAPSRLVFRSLATSTPIHPPSDYDPLDAVHSNSIIDAQDLQFHRPCGSSHGLGEDDAHGLRREAASTTAASTAAVTGQHAVNQQALAARPVRQPCSIRWWTPSESVLQRALQFGLARTR